jgi:hypothetical protein
MHGGGVVDGLAVVGVGVLAHLPGGGAVPGVGVGVDEPLGRPAGLAEEEPVIPADRELRVAAGQRLADRNAFHQAQPAHQLRVVDGQPLRDVRSAVVPGQAEPLVPELPHQGRAVVGHGSLGVGGMVSGGDGLGRLPVAAQVRADHGEPLGQHRGDPVPGGVGPRMAVQQQDGRSAASVADPQLYFADLDPPQRKALEALAQNRSPPVST